MPRIVHFTTPENIDVQYELAGLGSRFAAAVIDHTIQGLMIFGSYLLLLLISGMSFGGTFSDAPMWANATFILAMFVIFFGYFIFFELKWGGVTPGRKVMGLRAVRDGGYSIDVYSSVVRNLVRIVDMLPPMYGIGIISIFASKQYKRLGDFAAGTVVIKERPEAALAAPIRVPLSDVAMHYLPLVNDVDRLSRDDIELVREFLRRKETMEVAVQADLANRIAIPLLNKMETSVEVPIQWHYADLLAAIELRRHQFETGDFVTQPIPVYEPVPRSDETAPDVASLIDGE
jgi:uncharacterized RDD family membrane protein YckC